MDRAARIYQAPLARALALPDAVPVHGLIGLLLVAAAWSVSWLHVSPFGQYAFFPLWLGYILAVDALVLRRTGTSLLTRSPVAFLGMFAISVPLWWAFEGINHFTQNWHYLGAEHYSATRYALVASLHFSVVIPAVFETAELIGSFGLVDRLRQGPCVKVSGGLLIGTMAVGAVSLVSLFVWPGYAFPATWLSLFLLLDPINYRWGHPSVLGWLRWGDWRPLITLSAAALVCGWFWEMWNFWAMPKWEYNIAFADFVHVFEMPLLGYGGYLPFGPEVFAGYHFLSGVVGGRDYLRLTSPSWAPSEFKENAPIPLSGDL